MPMATVQQTSFNGGEISESLYGRTDLTKYDTAVRTMRNFIPTLQGNAVNRPGTQFVAEVIDSTKDSRLIPFQFSVTQTYILEFGDGIMRIISDGGLVVYPVGHASAGDPVEVVTPYSHEDVFRIQYAQSADVLYLVHPSYPPQKVSRFSNTEWTCDTIPFGTATSTPTGLASDAVGTTYYYKVTAVKGGDESLPSDAAGSSSETSNLSWNAVFGADYYNVYKLKNGSYNWVGEADGASFTDSTLVGDASKRPPDANNPFSNDPVLESIGPNLVPVQSFVSQTASSGGGWTTTASSAFDSDSSRSIYRTFDGVKIGTQGIVSGDTSLLTVTITPDIATEVGAYSLSAGGYASQMPKTWTFEGYDGADWITLDTRSNEVSWATNETRVYDFVNEVEYEEYRIDITAANGSYPGIAEMELFTATYSEASNYPGSVTLHQQRLVFGRTDANPDTLFGSKTGNYTNFDISRPLQDDDSYEFTLASNQVNEIQWLAAVRNLLAGTSGTEWSITGGQGSGAITPNSVDVSDQGNRGSEPIQPVIIGSSLLFVARGGQSVRDYGFSFDIDGYTGDELSVLARHLFEQAEVKSWSFQKNPYSVLWIVKNDGNLIGLTYDKNQQVVGWHRHDTAGQYESVAVIQGGD